MSVKSWDIVGVADGPLSVRVHHRGGERSGGARPGNGSGRRNAFQAELSGFEEVPPILTAGTGRFRAQINADGVLEYELSYSDLSSPAMEAHIHFGQPGVNGEVVVFLCGGGDAPACPVSGGRIMGTIEPADIMAVPEQGIEAGNLSGLLRAMRAGATYVNVHTQQHPAGEIRGQIRPLSQAQPGS